MSGHHFRNLGQLHDLQPHVDWADNPPHLGDVHITRVEHQQDRGRAIEELVQLGQHLRTQIAPPANNDAARAVVLRYRHQRQCTFGDRGGGLEQRVVLSDSDQLVTLVDDG